MMLVTVISTVMMTMTMIYINSENNDDDEDDQKPDRVKQTLPGTKEIGPDNLQKNHLFDKQISVHIFWM